MKQEKDKYALSSVNKSELEDDQWFPKVPAKKQTKWSLVIALLDEFAILVIVIVVIYFLIKSL